MDTLKAKLTPIQNGLLATAALLDRLAAQELPERAATEAAAGFMAMYVRDHNVTPELQDVACALNDLVYGLIDLDIVGPRRAALLAQRLRAEAGS